jgi:hypothetical protein
VERHLAGDTTSTFRLRYWMVGCFATSRKSAERRWVSRSATPVSMLTASISTSTDEAARFAVSRDSFAFHFAKWPRTFEITMWRTVRFTVEWAPSTCQFC